MMIRSACVSLVVASLSTAALQAQSLAGAAKKAGEASAKAKQADGQKTVDKPATKVYTNKDLGDVPPSTATTTPTETSDSKTPSGSAATPASPATPAATSTPQDERSWRARARDLRRTLADDQTKLAAAKVHYDSLPDTAKGAVDAPIVDAWMKAREEISRLTAAVANDQRAISELEDEARRAGVPPGWLRDR